MVEKQEVVEMLKEIANRCGVPSVQSCEYIGVAREIPNFITISVCEDVQGGWLDCGKIKHFGNTNINIFRCSRCGFDFCDIINNQIEIYNYCPHCGANMKQGENKEVT